MHRICNWTNITPNILNRGDDMAKAAYQKGNLVDEWKQGNVGVKIYDGALVAKTRDDPKVQEIMNRITKIAFRVAEEAHNAGRKY